MPGAGEIAGDRIERRVAHEDPFFHAAARDERLAECSRSSRDRVEYLLFAAGQPIPDRRILFEMAAQRARQEGQRRRVPAGHAFYCPRVGSTEGLPRSYSELDLVIGNDSTCRKQRAELV